MPETEAERKAREAKECVEDTKAVAKADGYGKDAEKIAKELCQKEIRAAEKAAKEAREKAPKKGG